MLTAAQRSCLRAVCTRRQLSMFDITKMKPIPYEDPEIDPLEEGKKKLKQDAKRARHLERLHFRNLKLKRKQTIGALFQKLEDEGHDPEEIRDIYELVCEELEKEGRKIPVRRRRRVRPQEPVEIADVDISCCDIFENVEEPPSKSKALHEYPPWLWTVDIRPPPLEDQEFVRWENFSKKDKRRFFKMHRTENIKQSNLFTKKM
jgi:hypothetical protein